MRATTTTSSWSFRSSAPKHPCPQWHKPSQNSRQTVFCPSPKTPSTSKIFRLSKTKQLLFASVKVRWGKVSRPRDMPLSITPTKSNPSSFRKPFAAKAKSIRSTHSKDSSSGARTRWLFARRKPSRASLQKSITRYLSMAVLDWAKPTWPKPSATNCSI